jgi:hypothetical protein
LLANSLETIGCNHRWWFPCAKTWWMGIPPIGIPQLIGKKSNLWRNYTHCVFLKHATFGVESCSHGKCMGCSHCAPGSLDVTKSLSRFFRFTKMLIWAYCGILDFLCFREAL